MKRLLLVIISIALVCMFIAGCSPDDPFYNRETTTEETTTASEQTTEPTKKEDKVNIDGYKKDLDGLCKYLKDLEYISGDSKKMAAELIGAKSGFKYTFKYEDSDVVAELYAFDKNNLNDTAKEVIASVKEKGEFSILNLRAVKAQLTDNQTYLIVYKDAGTGEKNIQRSKDFYDKVNAFDK